MPYRFELFVSYPRIWRVEAWLKDFLPYLEFYLTQELKGNNYTLENKTARIFRDDQIETGQLWPQVLRDAARDSCCVLPILMPEYRDSLWCRAEFQTFKNRANGLVVPVQYYRDENQDIHAEQIFDFTNYTTTQKHTRKWEKCERRIMKLAQHTANRIMAAPPYPEDPESERWLVRDIPEQPPKRPFSQRRL